MPVDQGPTVADIERIVALTDPVIRNLQITQCYYELAQPLVFRLGENANWCSFATWASRQAGQTIRKEDLARTLEHVLGSHESIQLVGSDLASALRSIGFRPETRQIVGFIFKVLDPEAAFGLVQ